MKSNLEIKTSFVSPITLKVFSEHGYLPIFIIRNIKNSELIAKFSDTSIHFKNLAPSNELFRAKRDEVINFDEFAKRYIIEMSTINFQRVIERLEYLAKLSGARGVVLLGFGSDNKICHRSILAGLLNDSGLLENRITELII